VQASVLSTKILGLFSGPLRGRPGHAQLKERHYDVFQKSLQRSAHS